ncbi:hypothetical protein Tco_0984887 [Tanacetum coccineum]
MPLSKKKEKVDVTRGKGHELLSQSGFENEVAQFDRSSKEGGSRLMKKSSEIEAESWGNDKDDNNNDQDSNNENELDSEHETGENDSGSEFDQEENEEDIEDDEEEVKDDLVKTPSNDSNDEDETKITDKAEGDEDEEIDYTTNQLYDDVDIRLNEPVDTDKGFIQKEEDAHVTLSTVPQKTEVPVTNSSHSSDLASKFLNFSDIPHTNVISPMDVYVHHEAILAKESSQPQFSYEAVATLTEFKLKKILIDKMDKIKSYLAAPEHRECYEGLIKSYDLDKTLFSAYDKVYSLKRSRKDKDKDEDPSVGSDRGLKKRKTSKNSEPTKDFGNATRSRGDLGNDDEEPKEKVASKHDCWLMTLASSADKPSKTFDELMSTPIDFSAFIMNGLKLNNLTHETLLGPAFRLLKGIRSNYAELEYDFEEFMSGKRQKVLVDYFFNNDLKYLQGGVSTMTYTNSITKTKAAQYDLPSIEDMVQVIRKHGYGYLQEIVVRRADNDLYKFKEGDFPRLCINDIEDMLLLVVQNRLTNLSGHGVSDFNILMEYLPKKRWSTLEKKRANIMIKAIDKQLKERSQNRRDLPRDIPLDSVVVLRYEKRSKSKNKGKVPTEMELVLEQTQQGTSYEVSVSAEGVEELKRKVKIKGEKKEALLTLRQKPGQYICCQESQR